MDTTTARFYANPAHQVAIQERIAKTNRRLKAVHAEGQPLRAEFTTEHYTDKHGNIYPVLAMDLTWHILSAGWTLAGVITPTGDATNYTYTPITLPREAIEISDLKWCDHCHTRRQRSRVFVITNDDGQMMMVGSTCLQPFTGLQATTGLLQILAMDPYYLLDDLASMEVPDDDEKLARLGSEPQRDTTNLVLQGLVIYPAWRDRGVKDHALSLADYVMSQDPTTEGEDTAERVEQIRQIRAHAATHAASSDYWDNVNVALSSQITGRRHMRLVISAVSSWHTALNKAAEQQREREATVQEPWAPVGTRLKDHPVEVTLHRVASYETHYTYYGETQHVYTFRTDAGHQLVWKTQNQLTTHQDTEMEPGDRLRLTAGSVKEHGTYRDNVQTVLTRVRYEPLANPTNA